MYFITHRFSKSHRFFSPSVFVRADFNVPIEKGVITDDTRIRGAIPTIKYLVSQGAKVLLSSHLGRPKGGYESKFSLAPITPRLSELLGKNVPLVPDCIGISFTILSPHLYDRWIPIINIDSVYSDISYWPIVNH